MQRGDLFETCCGVPLPHGVWISFRGLVLTACTDVADNLPVATSAPPMQTVYLIQFDATQKDALDSKLKPQSTSGPLQRLGPAG